MDKIFIFTDAATSAKMNISVGVFLCLGELSETNIAEQVIYETYASKKSTESEIKIAIAALTYAISCQHKLSSVELYTDCQNLCDLLGKRKEKLQQNNFMTRSGKTLAHAALYQELYRIADQLQITVFKVKGHAAKRVGLPERIFSIIDKLCRKKLRSLTN